MTPTPQTKRTAAGWGAIILAILIGWVTFKVVLHLVAALVAGVVVLVVAFFLYFRFFRRA